jgi:hypothetical protein
MPPMQGQMQRVMNELLSATIGIEVLYSFVIILCSLMVYFGTKELYELSNHKGIKYFRLSFLFFAIAYFFRSFIKFLVYLFGVNAIVELSPFISTLTLFIFLYASSMAIFYLFYSMVCKKWENKCYLFHVAAIIVSLAIILFKDPWIYFGINVVLFLLLTIGIYLMHTSSKGKKKNKFFIVYILLFAFWILNIVDILIPNVIGQYQVTLYLISLGIFMFILFKVLKKAG